MSGDRVNNVPKIKSAWSWVYTGISTSMLPCRWATNSGLHSATYPIHSSPIPTTPGALSTLPHDYNTNTQCCYWKGLIRAYCLAGPLAPTQKCVSSVPGSPCRKALNPIRQAQTQNNEHTGVGSPNPAVTAKAPLNVRLSCQAEEKQMDFPRCRGVGCCRLIEEGNCIAVQLSAL